MTNEATNLIVQELSGIREELKQIKQISLDTHYPEKEHATLTKIYWAIKQLIHAIDEPYYGCGEKIQNSAQYSGVKWLIPQLEERLEFIASAQRPRKMVCGLEIVSDVKAADRSGALL